MILKKSILMLAALSGANLPEPAQAQFVSQQVIAVESSTSNAQEFLQGAKGTPVLLAGHLRLAKPGPKQPVVVLMHGGAGLAGWNGVTNEWARVLNEAGISTFNLDGFTGRQKFTPAEQGALPAIIRMHDAYAALSVLSKHPLVDADKIVVMGFSQGSVAALYANLARFQKQYGPAAKFAAHISVYGICATKYREDEDVQAPLLMVHGAADDWVPAEPCAEYAERLTKAGKTVRLITYQDAVHGFDGPAVGPVKKLDLPTGGYCRLQEATDGSIVSSDTQKPLADSDACRRKGVSLGYNETSMKKAHEDVVAFLKQVLK